MSARVCVLLGTRERVGDSLTLGQARAALFGWLYARHEGGTLVLRVAGREIEAICEELRWLGIEGEVGALSRAGASPDSARDGVPGDHKLEITHVLLDAQDLPRMEQERALYRASGREPPQYLSLPALPLRDGAAQNPGTLAAYRARGYLPLALANCLARLDWTPRGKRALLSLAELAARFDPRRVLRSPAPFDLEQLNWFNRRALRGLDVADLTALLVPRWQAAYGGAICGAICGASCGAVCGANRAAGTALTPVQWQQALALALRDELDGLDQAVQRARFAFVDEIEMDEQAREVLSQPYAAEVLCAFARELPAVEPFLYDQIDSLVGGLRQRFKAALGATLGVRSRDVMYVLRAALTGRMEGPCLVEVCQLLGRERCIQRARRGFDNPLGAVGTKGTQHCSEGIARSPF